MHNFKIDAFSCVLSGYKLFAASLCVLLMRWDTPRWRQMDDSASLTLKSSSNTTQTTSLSQTRSVFSTAGSC